MSEGSPSDQENSIWRELIGAKVAFIEAGGELRQADQMKATLLLAEQNLA